MACTALCELRSADFVAGAAVCEPRSTYFVGCTALCEPRSADFVADPCPNRNRSVPVDMIHHFLGARRCTFFLWFLAHYPGKRPQTVCVRSRGVAESDGGDEGGGRGDGGGGGECDCDCE